MKTKRMSRMAKKSLIAGLVLALCVVACETVPKGAALGGLLGAGTGAIIGHQTGHQGTGALIGGLVGAAAGAAVSKLRIDKAQEKQLASRADVEEEYRAKGVDISSEPRVEIEELVASPPSVQPGETVSVQGRYVAMGADDPKPTGKFRVLLNKAPVAESELEISNTGRSEFTKEIGVPEDFAVGTYECVVEIQQGNSRYEKCVPFMVASSS